MVDRLQEEYNPEGLIVDLSNLKLEEFEEIPPPIVVIGGNKPRLDEDFEPKPNEDFKLQTNEGYASGMKEPDYGLELNEGYKPKLDEDYVPEVDDNRPESDCIIINNLGLDSYSLVGDSQDCPVDTRKKVDKEFYRSPPYSNIFRIKSIYKNTYGGDDLIFYGSGVLVGPRHILTAYSIIHQKDLGDALSVEVSSQIANMNAKMIGNLNFGVNDAEEELKYYKDVDLTLLVLDKALGLTLGYLPMIAVKTTKPLTEELHAAGYSTLGSLLPILWTNEGKCKDPKQSLETGIAEHDIRTDIEMVGCPIYAEVIGKDKRTSYYVISIQSFEGSKGIILTEERLSRIKNKIIETK